MPSPAVTPPLQGKTITPKMAWKDLAAAQHTHTKCRYSQRELLWCWLTSGHQRAAEVVTIIRTDGLFQIVTPVDWTNWTHFYTHHHTIWDITCVLQDPGRRKHKSDPHTHTHAYKCTYLVIHIQMIDNLHLCLSFPTNKSKPAFLLCMNQSTLHPSHKKNLLSQTNNKGAQITTSRVSFKPSNLSIKVSPPSHSNSTVINVSSWEI